MRGPSSLPGPLCSFVVGVGSSWPGEDEDALSLVGSADLRSLYDRPFRIEPEVGQVAEYGAKSAKNESCSCGWIQIRSAGSQTAISFLREEAADILDHHQSGLEGLDGAGDVEPEAGAGAVGDARSQTGEADVLAGEAGGEDVDGLDLIPVDGGDVAMVGDVGPVPVEDLRGVLVLVVGVVLAVPGDGSAEDGLDGHVEAAVARAEAADAGAAGVGPRAQGRARGAGGCGVRVHRLGCSSRAAMTISQSVGTTSQA